MVVFLLLLGINPSLAQTFSTSPFTTVSEASLALTSDGLAQKGKLSAGPRKGNLRYALVGNFSDWGNASNGRVSFSIPGYESRVYQAQSLETSYLGPESYTYIGKIDGDANGNFAITRDPEGITGFIQLSTEFYSFYPLGNNKVVFVQDTTLSGIECGVDASSTVLANFCSPEENECSSLIDIQALIHSLAVGVVPVGFAQMSTLQFNAVLLNSRIYNKKVRVRVSQLPFSFGLTTSIGNDLTNFRNSSQAQTFKENAGADITVLLTNQMYGGGLTFGLAFTAVNSGQDAFAIVDASSALGGRFTFVHECAHISGALHNRAANGGDNDNLDCAHGLRYVGASGVIRTTIMARLGVGSRIPYFSNPNVLFDGVRTGLTGNDMVAADNAKKLRNASCTTDDFEKPNNMYVQIAGKRGLCIPETQTYQALITEGKFYGKSPFTVVWTYSTTPAGIQTSLSNTPITNTVSISTALAGTSSSIYLTVVVTGMDGFTYTETRQIFVGICSFQASNDREGSIEKVETSGITLHPNPASDEIFIGSQQVNRPLYQAELFNVLGQRVIVTAYDSAGRNQIRLDLSELTPGIYFARCRTAGGVVTKAFTLQP